MTGPSARRCWSVAATSIWPGGRRQNKVAPMADRFEVAILGAGPAGEHAAYALGGDERKVLLVERELIGGECSNWARIPTQTLLRPSEVRGESERRAGVLTPALAWPDL